MPVSLWLRPAAPDAEALDAAIADYARLRGLTPFPAHLTLASGNNLSEDELAVLASGAAAFSLEPDGYLETPAFFQVFALRYLANQELLTLRARACEMFGTADTTYIPHVSLTYGFPKDREALLKLAGRFDQPIRFDRLMMIRYEDLEPSQAAVANWRLGTPIPLGV